MTTASSPLAAAIEEVQAIVSADGARLDVLEETAGLVHFRLDLAGASCADCVLPPGRLTDVVQTSLRRRTGNDTLVVRIDDPRKDDGSDR
jgi:hypothetical protein